jgi:prevent-host-death family protein
MARKNANRTISTVEAGIRFAELVKQASADEGPIVVEEDGVPMAVILSLPHYEQLRAEARLARFEQFSRAAGLDAEGQALTEEQLEQEMEEIKQRLHQEFYG